MGSKTYINPEIKQQLVDAYLAGATSISIAKSFGVHKDVVRRAIKKANVGREVKRLTEQQRQVIIEKYNGGWKIPEIVEFIGFSSSVVEVAIRRAGINNRAKILSEELKSAIIADYIAGKPLKEIYCKHSTNSCTVFRLAKDEGVLRKRHLIDGDKRQRIIDAYMNGSSMQKIAKSVSVTPGTVSNILQKASCKLVYNSSTVKEISEISKVDIRRPPEKVNEEKQASMVDMYRKGISSNKIAKLFGASTSATLKYLRAAGLEIRYKRGAINDHSEKIAKLYIEGETLETIARQMGFSLTAIYKLLLREGVSIRTISETSVPIKWLKSSERKKITYLLRSLPQYFVWRNAIRKRDSKTCQLCGAKGKEARVEVDHIYPFSAILIDYNIKTIEDGVNCKALWDISNGRVLCKACHKQTPTYGLKARRLKEGWEMNDAAKTSA